MRPAPSWPCRAAVLLLAAACPLLASCRTCQRCLEPRAIPGPFRAAPELVAATREAPLERGEPRRVIDGIGWVVGIPSKIILWDRRVDDHDVGSETADALRDYLDDNGLDHVKVRVNQYAPLADWRRLRLNRTVGWPLRYTIGTLSVAAEAIFPGRIVGGDHYNPWTATIHLYSDVPAIALHEGGHAKDFARRDWPGLYAVAFGLPITQLYPEALATGDALAHLAERDDADARLAEARRILYPAYGTYVGGAAGEVVGLTVGLPVYAGAVVAGHVVGRWPAAAGERGADAEIDERVPAESAADDADDAGGADDAALPAAFIEP